MKRYSYEEDAKHEGPCNCPQALWYGALLNKLFNRTEGLRRKTHILILPNELKSELKRAIKFQKQI